MSESLRKHPDSPDSLASSKASRHSEDKSHCSKLQKGATVRTQMASNSSLSGQQILKLLSRLGKVTGQYANSWNVRDERREISSVDFKHDVTLFEIVSNTLTDTALADEVLLNEVMVADQTSAIYQAKLQELASWNERDVYEEVPNNGQPYMTVRWVVTQKNVKNQPVTKARSVAHGFQETQDFRKVSPTCSQESVRLTLAIIASMSWKLKSLDVKTAFLQGQIIDRTIHILPPPEAETQALWKLRKCIYRPADAPRCFYMHLHEVLSELNVYPDSVDEGFFFAKSKITGELIGIIACHVDDLLFGGTDEFHLQVIEQLRVALEFGTENSGAFTFIGMHVTQHTDMSITLDQLIFAASISPIELSPGRQQTKKAPLTDEEQTQFRARIGQLNWLATVSHPEISFDVCQASSRVRDASVSDIIELNKVIYNVKKEQAYIHFPKLTFSSLKSVF